jgi:hypothetical protein
VPTHQQQFPLLHEPSSHEASRHLLCRLHAAQQSAVEISTLLTKQPTGK